MHRFSTTVEKERPQLNEETKRLIALCRRDPTEENLAAPSGRRELRCGRRAKEGEAGGAEAHGAAPVQDRRCADEGSLRRHRLLGQLLGVDLHRAWEGQERGEGRRI